MTPFFQLNLTLHIIFGLLGLTAFYTTWMVLLKQKLSIRFLKFSSVAGLISFLLSWISGFFYYTLYYGKSVKPIIKGGQYPWAHALFMEAKEHIFILLPFLAALVSGAILISGKGLEGKPKLKRPITYLTGLIFILGAIVTLFGVVVSGAVR